MRLARLSAALAFSALAALGLGACGKDKAAQSGAQAVASCGSTSGSASGTALSDCAAKTDGSATTTPGAATTVPAEAAKQGSGLADFCKWTPNDKGGGCMACTPRELEVLKCAKTVKADFDPAKDCDSDKEKLLVSCEVGGNEDFVFDMAKPSTTEAIFDKLPLLVAGAKFLIADKFKDNPKKDLILGAIDIFAKHAKALLNNGDVAPAADDIAALAKQAKPGIKDAEIAAIKSQLIASVGAVQTRRRSGDFADTDMMTLLLGFVQNMPADIVGDSLKGVDLSILASALAGSGGGTDILSILTGGVAAAAKAQGSGSGSSSTSGS